MSASHEKGLSSASNPSISAAKQELEAPTQPPPFPEGGLRAWCTVFGAWLVQFATFGYLNAFGVYQDFYVREYLTNKTSAQISLIGSVQLFFALSLGIVTGKLFDKGFFYHMMIMGSLLSGFSMFMLSLSKPGQYYQVFLSQGIAQGISVGLTFLPTLGITAHYFQRKRGIAMGVVVTGSSLGGTLHPIMLNQLIFGKLGFHRGVRASAGLITGLLIVGNLLMRTRLPARKEAAAVNIPSFAKDSRYVFTVLGTFFTMLGLFFPIFYLQLYSITHGLDANFAFYTLAILNGASILGRVLPNLLLHALGVYNLILFCTAASGGLIFALFGLHTIAATTVFAIIYGFFSGAFISLLAPMFSSLAKDFSEIGARMGIGFFFNGVAAFIGNPVAGALLSDSLAWWRPIVFSGVVVFAGASSLAVARGLVSGSKGNSKKV